MRRWLCIVLAGTCMMARAGGVVSIVYAEASTRPADAAYSKATARNLARWLEAGGLSASVHSDKDIRQALAPPCTVAHLLNVTQDSAPVMTAIDSFLAHGGKLVVHNSSAPALSARFGIHQKKYIQPPVFGAWTQLTFDKGKEIAGAPKSITQIVGGIHDSMAIPKSNAVVIAQLASATGVPTGFPALYRHPRGYWLVPALLDTGEREGRRRLATALTCSLDTTLWKVAFEALSKPFYGVKIGMEIQEPMFQAARTGDYAAAVRWAWDFQVYLAERAAAQELPWKGSVRAVWDHEGYGLYPGDWDRTCATLAACGITDLLVHVADPATGSCPIPALAQNRLLKDHGDQLRAAVAAGHRHGMRVHAWISVFKAEGGGATNLASVAYRIAEASAGSTVWLDPGRPEARTRMIAIARHIATQYAVDGIHLDYIRYPDRASSLTTQGRKSFEAWLKRPVKDWPQDVRYPRNVLYAEFNAYRAECVTETVRTIREMLRAEGKANVTLTAAVYGKHSTCVDAVGQDWMEWLRKGLVDQVFPMNYTASQPTYAGFIKEQAADAALRKRIISGIGITAAESALDAPTALRQIRMAREAGLGGFALFSLGETLRQEILPCLALGVTK